MPLDPSTYLFSLFFFFNDPATPEIYTLSLHDALPICGRRSAPSSSSSRFRGPHGGSRRSEEHTSELQSRFDLVCRLLLEKKKQNNNFIQNYDLLFRSGNHTNMYNVT